MLISFQIRQNEEIDGCYEMKAVYIYIYNLHNGECASVFNALFKTRRVSAFAFLRGLNMQLLQSPMVEKLD